MNARTQAYEIELSRSQVRDAACAFIHTIFFQRSTGKTLEEHKATSIRSIVFEDVDCVHIDCTYVRIKSPDLIRCVNEVVEQLVDKILSADASSSLAASVSLQFHETAAKTAFPFLSAEKLAWRSGRSNLPLQAIKQRGIVNILFKLLVKTCVKL